jgi:tRNA(Arg) A34 adenosine deaminase TadA
VVLEYAARAFEAARWLSLPGNIAINFGGKKIIDIPDHTFIHEAIQIAHRARNNGNHPFGALLVDEQGHVLLEAENTVVTARDCTGHAELNLVRLASQSYDAGFLAGCTLYTSTEPCPMCAGAIFWSNVRRVVYGLSEAGLYAMVGDDATEILFLPCGELFARGKKPIEVIGPILEDEAREVHSGFWK